MAQDPKEDSVQFALKDLMQLEDERLKTEEEDRRRRDEEDRRRREEEERRRREEEERQRREEEQRRLAEEQAKQEAEERKRREEELARLRVIKESEAKGQADEAERLARIDLERQKIVAEQKKVPTWVFGAVAVLVIGLVGIGVFFWYQGETERQRLEAQNREEARQLQDQIKAQEVATKRQIEEERRRREEESHRTKQLEAEAAALRAAQEQATKTAPDDTAGPRVGRRRQGDSSDPGSETPRPRRPSPGALSDDPLDGLQL